MDKTIRENNIVHAMDEIECYQIDFNNVEIKEYSQIPLAQLSAMSATFSSLANDFKNAIGSIRKKDATEKLFRLIDPLNGKGRITTVGNLYQKGKRGISARARYVEVVPSAAKTVVKVNPTTMLMAATLSTITKKIDEIHETQKDILEFLQLKEKAVLKGNIAVLQEVLDEYRYNWDNEKYKNSKYIQVQEIKRDSEQSIVLCREQIEKKLSKKGLLHSDRDVKSKIQKIRYEFKDYELAMYIFSFASFMEVMLLENFNSGYLNSVTNKIELYSKQYTELQEKCYEQIEKDSQTSVQSRVLKGVAGLNKALGEGIAKIPKIRDGQVDETLISAGEKVDEFNDKRTENTLDLLESEKCTCVRPFIDNIIAINIIHNEDMDILFDSENIYFKLPNITK